MIIQLHPDNLIYIRTSNNEVIFCGSFAETESILGKPLAPLPNGVRERQYFVGQYVADFTNAGQVNGPSEWPDAIDILSKLEIFKNAYQEKLQKLQAAALGIN